MSQKKIYYYLYKITNLINQKIYIGVHKTKNLNDHYTGCVTYKFTFNQKYCKRGDKPTLFQRAIMKYKSQNWKKQILQFFDSQQQMYKREAEIVTEEFIKLDTNYNITIGGQSNSWCHCKNKITVKDKDDNTFQVDKNDTRYLSGQLVGVCKGTIMVKDKNGNCFRVDKNDPRYLSGELTSVIHANHSITMKDKNGNYVYVDVNDQRIKSGQLTGVFIGQVNAITKDGKIIKVNVDDPRFQTGQIINYMKATVIVEDIKTGKRTRVLKTDERLKTGQFKIWNKSEFFKSTRLVYDQNHNKIRVDKNDPKLLNGIYQLVNPGCFKVQSLIDNKIYFLTAQEIIKNSNKYKVINQNSKRKLEKQFNVILN